MWIEKLWLLLASVRGECGWTFYITNSTDHDAPKVAFHRQADSVATWTQPTVLGSTIRPLEDDANGRSTWELINKNEQQLAYTRDASECPDQAQWYKECKCAVRSTSHR